MIPHIPELTSTNNPLVKRVVRLRQRSHRKADGLTVIDGRDELMLALKAGYRPEHVFVCIERTQDADVQAIHSAAPDVPLQPCHRAVFDKMAYRQQPDGYLAIGPQPGVALADLALPDRPLLLVGEAIEKPGNVGAMLRTADAVGADAVILANPRTDAGNPNVIRASRGTVFTMPLASADNREVIDFLRRHGVSIVLASPEAKTPYDQADLGGPVAIVCGEEHHGLSRSWHDAANAAVRIPMMGSVNSLNVSVSAAILLYEARRQRGFYCGFGS